MDFTICYLEVLNDKTSQWEYVANSNVPKAINSWFNNLEPFFEEFNLYFLLQAIATEDQFNRSIVNNGLLHDCSKIIEKTHHFYFEEIKVCQKITCHNLSNLLVFDYNKTINLMEVTNKQFKRYFPKGFDKTKQTMTHKEWLGEDYFIELQRTKQRFGETVKCRLICFLGVLN